MIILTKSIYLNKSYYGPWIIESESYKLISTVSTDIGIQFVCERLNDEVPVFPKDGIKKFKGQIFSDKIENFRIIKDTSLEDVDIERMKYLDELKQLVQK